MASSTALKRIRRHFNSAISSLLTSRTMIAFMSAAAFIVITFVLTQLISAPNIARLDVDVDCGHQTSATTGSITHLTPIRSQLHSRIVPISRVNAFDSIASAPAGSPLALLYQCVSQPAQLVIRIAVITSISATPTNAMIQIASLNEPWCVIVIGDTNGPTRQMFTAAASSNTTSAPAYMARVIYFDSADQSRLPYRLVSILPERSFSRKNIGYLIAIHAGAHVIFDLDDDNVYSPQLSSNGLPIHLKSTTYISPRHHVIVTDEEVSVDESERVLTYNPYPYYGAVRAWPRGFPLSHVKRSFGNDVHSSRDTTSVTFTCTAVIQQILTNVHPDVDAIYRMTNDGVPFNFAPPSIESGESSSACIAVPDGAYTPYNAQATIHLAHVFPLLLLPTTVHGRVSDIWRSYIAQTVMTYDHNTTDRAFHCLRLSPPCIIFTPPYITHQRNRHDDKRDFNSERPLYELAEALLAWLTQRKAGAVHDIKRHYSLAPTTSVYFQQLDIILLLYNELYSVGVIDVRDVTIAELWRSDLSRMPLQATTANSQCDAAK